MANPPPSIAGQQQAQSIKDLLQQSRASGTAVADRGQIVQPFSPADQSRAGHAPARSTTQPNVPGGKKWGA
jgi:hypothetical protein